MQDILQGLFFLGFFGGAFITLSSLAVVLVTLFIHSPTAKAVQQKALWGLVVGLIMALVGFGICVVSLPFT